MKKYPLYMWILALSGVLERQGKFNLCLRYYFKMLDIFEDLLHSNFYSKRFQIVAARTVTKNKKEKKWVKIKMRIL